MTKQLLIYSNVAPLNRATHRDLAVSQTHSFAFAAQTNTVPVVDVEFVKCASEMPVVFARTETGVVCVAVLGTEQDRNAFVKADNSWDGRYVPAFFRRYPFVFAADEGSDRLTLCIDEAYEGLNSEGRGERLFDSEGIETTYTRNILKFVEEYQATFSRTQAFCTRLEELDLLEEARIDYVLGDGSRGGLTGFLRVSTEKLRALPDDAALRLFRSGDLDLIQLHLMSLQQVEPLVNRLSRGKAADAPQAASVPETAAVN